ncbi:MAG TPA: DUF4293 domain-containing protein [Ohtaekwangia sp.]|nr:DUF4293 domain-containing protein [Ohtaekwangia sp.]
MWQRIQTVFLAIGIVSLIGAILLPIWGTEEGGTVHRLYALQYVTIKDGERSFEYIPYALTGILFIASITIAFIEIRKYKDRILQIKLGALNSLILVGGYAAAVYFGSGFIKSSGGTYGLGIWLPAVAVLANWLALRFIRRDERIVRDSNRLR